MKDTIIKDSYQIPQFILDSYKKYKETYKTTAKRLRFSKKTWKIVNAGKEKQTQEWLDFLKKETGLDINMSYIFFESLSKGLIKYIPIKCPICGKLLNTYQVRIGVSHCSEKCRSSNPAIKEKARQTYQRKYGVDAPSQAKEIREKMNATLMKHYGVSSPFASKEIRDKAKKTLLDRYGVDCSFKNPEIREKAKQTNLERYGVEYTFSNKDVQNKIKETVRKKYGVDHIIKSKKVQKKIQNTLKEKYGVDTPFASEKIRNKAKETLIKHYGVDNPYKSKEIFDRVKATCLERYGVERPAQNKEILAKIENTRLEKYGSKSFRGSKELEERRKVVILKKYGVDEIFKSKEFFKKAKQTTKEHYGVEYPAQDEKLFQESQITKRKNLLPKILSMINQHHFTLVSDANEYINNRELKVKCNTCNNTWIAHNSNDLRNCPYCAKKHITSQAEKDLLAYIKSLYDGQITENNKSLIKLYELDIYLPEKKLAFEFNGTYWHSDKFKNKKYHQQKSILCNRKHVRLVHIFEYEWTFNQEKIKNLIKSALGIFDVRLFARKCNIQPISSLEYKQFLEAYHLQGAVNSSVRYGLFYKDELVSVIGFGKSRFKQGEVELHRYCVKAGYQIVGGFSKLIKHACKESKIKSFVSFIDLAHFNGRGYKKAGFKLVSVTSPSYIYIRGDELRSRMQCQKHKLSAFLEAYDPEMSEYENMLMNDWDRVYDCGNIKVEYTFSKNVL